MSRYRLLLCLRIAWSAACVAACLLLIALWVRSYWVIEGIGRGRRTSPEATLVLIISNNGTLAFVRESVPATLNFVADITDDWSYRRTRPEFAAEERFSWTLNNKVFEVQFPTWLPVLFLAGAAVVPWMELKWRFSLRALLIFTVIVAVAFGLVTWLVRSSIHG